MEDKVLEKNMETPPKNLTDAKRWQAEQFVPWQQAMAKHMQAREAQRVLLLKHLGALQSMVALLLDGKTKAAMQAWNMLGLSPRLRDLKLAADGESLTLVSGPAATDVQVLALDEVIGDLERLVTGKSETVAA
jgi:hypothetical protein